ncbi:type I-E CRISPR-associated protein Cas7/Cse4/CasC [Enemella evansiae]|uniref:Type I-E CRISPR-associated protein Cas7/Cse4/CasC n=1 Tax=Enemella evansiae TaxID=2016499 RepID=A0A255GPL7_9ACTN|nr:type I-E CRISPR-associated protein Cas7/Cse4/CasC [Enemella evansiae]OYO17770.1 type I-E CRISPR-associated protein Cas7/Cse4/CasC [Enemella evansiae]
MTTHIDIHVLQTLPPSNINRDESGTPKSAIYGGVPRARVSSQAWKRAVRDRFKDTLDPKEVGVRTLRIVEELVNRIRNKSELDVAAAAERASEVIKKAGIKIKEPRLKKGEEPDPAKYVAEALVFFSNQQLDKLAELALTDGEISSKEAKAAADVNHGIDVGLFGRMVASAPDLNVDAAVQVAHAISTHAVDTQADFYTAVDDHKRSVSDQEDEDAGAGMMGDIEFNSSTLYRYASLSLESLETNIGDPVVTAKAVGAFVDAFVFSMPTGKQNSFSAQTLPDVVLVQVRTDRPVSLVGAFESPVKSGGDGNLKQSVRAMTDYANALTECYEPEVTDAWFLATSDDATSLLAGHGHQVTRKQLVQAVEERAEAILASNQ